MDGVGMLVGLAAFVMAIVALNKISTLDGQVRNLKRQLGLFSDELLRLRALGGVPSPAVADQPPAEPAAAELPPEQPIITAAPANGNAPEPATAEVPPALPPPPPKPARGDMEQALASRWFVWIGGVAIAIGGLLFVKYAYDNGLISPTLQVILGLLVAAVLVAAGEAVRRITPAGGDANYVPAALSAAGIATAFGSIYAGYALYEIISSLPAFIGLAMVGLGALVLSRRQGPFIAALGLLGSYATPALIPSDHPSAWGFFPYLLIILAACLATLRGRNWWWLGYGAIAAGTLWSSLWIAGGPFMPEDALPIGLYALASAAIAFFTLSGRAILNPESGTLLPPPTLTHPLGLGLAGILAMGVILAAVVQHTGHGAVSLLLMGVATLFVLALAAAKPGVAPLAPLAGLAIWLVLMVWPEAAMHDIAMDERGLWFSVLGLDAARFLRAMLVAGVGLMAVGLAVGRHRSPNAMWSLLAGGAAALFLWGAWGRVDSLHAAEVWAAFGLVGALVLLAAARLQKVEEPGNLAGGFFAAGAALLLVFAIDRLADNVRMTVALAALSLFFAVGARHLRSVLMGPITSALASFVTLRLFISRELWQDERGLPLGQHWVLYGYGVPAILFWIGSRFLRGAGHVHSAVALEGLSLGLALSLVSLELRVLINGNLVSDAPGLLEMAAHIFTWAGAAYGLMYRQQLFSSFVSLWGARLLLVASAAGMVVFSLTTLNPVVNEEPVPGNVVFNALLLAYLAPVPLLGLIAPRLQSLGWVKARPGLGLLALVLAFTYVTLETKRVFQGHLMQLSAESIAESYAYSAVWLAFAVALFAAGIRLGQQYVRYAGLGVMVLVVLKVFLWDMSSLEGLYRIFSFVGLGICLVGIGWLYQRFVQGVSKAT